MSVISQWKPDNYKFWQRHSSVAYRNLWLSSIALVCGFAVWLQWSTVSIHMLYLGFPFHASQLFSLTAIAGFSGAMLRIPASFLVRLYGGKASTLVMLTLLLLPATLTVVALRNLATPLWLFQLLALLSGIGGALFSVTMANVSQFFPHHQQGFALGLHAGIGNAGIALAQLVVPLAASLGALQLLGGSAQPRATSTVIKQVPGTADVVQWMHYSALLWLAALLLVALLIWLKLDTLRLPQVRPDQSLPSFSGSPHTNKTGAPQWARHHHWQTLTGVSLSLLLVLVVSALALYLLLPTAANGAGLGVAKELVVVGAVLAVLLLLPRTPWIGQQLVKQYSIFNNKHTWILSLMYAMSFGSLVGFAFAFPLAIQFIFGTPHVVSENALTLPVFSASQPNALMYGWLGPLVGVMARPLGGWLADQMGGARLTQWCASMLVVASVALAWVTHLAFSSATPEDYFVQFFLIMMVVFVACGLANGSTFKTITAVFPRAQALTSMGWIAAVGAMGAFYIPQNFGEHIQAGTPASALLGFALFYLLCLLLNQFFYLSRHAEYYNP